MGTMIQRHQLQEADYRGERFADWPCDVKGNNDLLALTRPDVIGGIHQAYLDAGADIIETNTFNATSIAMADYAMESLVWEINHAAARLVKELCAKASAANPAKPRYCAGVLGPTNRTCSISPDVNDPGYRNVSFDELVRSYTEAIDGLVQGGADLLLVETIFDTLNAKAAVFAIHRYFDERPDAPRSPIMISGTITDQSGRTLTGQTTEAFYNSLSHADAVSYGLNCALGPDLLRPYVEEMARVSASYVSVHANAGLPNAFGGYDLEPEAMGVYVREWAQSGLINIVGGCCGTTPEHIAAIARAVDGVAPRRCRGSRPSAGCPAWSRSTSAMGICSSMLASAPMSPATAPLPSSFSMAIMPPRWTWRVSKWKTAPRSSTSIWTRACWMPTPPWCASST